MARISNCFCMASMVGAERRADIRRIGSSRGESVGVGKSDTGFPLTPALSLRLRWAPARRVGEREKCGPGRDLMGLSELRTAMGARCVGRCLRAGPVRE